MMKSFVIKICVRTHTNAMNGSFRNFIARVFCVKIHTYMYVVVVLTGKES